MKQFKTTLISNDPEVQTVTNPKSHLEKTLERLRSHLESVNFDSDAFECLTFSAHKPGGQDDWIIRTYGYTIHATPLDLLTKVWKVITTEKDEHRRGLYLGVLEALVRGDLIEQEVPKPKSPFEIN